MAAAALAISKSLHDAIRSHLLQRDRLEQVAFAFTRPAAPSAGPVMNAIDWIAIPASDFVIQTKYHVELRDEARGAVIKRAHDLEAGLVEFHSHPTYGGACFSPSDIAGLRELVPHVRWRLKQRPYMAFVVALDGFDALAWTGDAHEPPQLGSLQVDGKVLRASGRTLTQNGVFHD